MELASVCSGSSGNCILVSSNDTNILVDVGISKKRVVEGLDFFDVNPNDIDAVLITHEHSDHISGLGVYLRTHPVSVYATKGTIDSILSKSSLGKVDKDLFEVIDSDEEFKIGDIKVKSIPTSHDASDSVCYRFEDDSSSCAIVTDLGYYHEELVRELQDLDGILIEANHDEHMLQVGSYSYELKSRIWSNVGHLSNETCGKLLCEILCDKLKYVILGHLSKENNIPELAYQTVRYEIDISDIKYTADDIKILVASRENPSCKIEF